jgi:hypothetical protein
MSSVRLEIRFSVLERWLYLPRIKENTHTDIIIIEVYLHMSYIYIYIYIIINQF